jgi:hypothetical protein
MNPNLQHYHVPSNADVLEVETMFVEEDDKIVNPLGIKGMGELGMVGIPAAIANAVFTRPESASAICRLRPISCCEQGVTGNNHAISNGSNSQR